MGGPFMVVDNEDGIRLSHPCDGQPETVTNFSEKIAGDRVACVELLLEVNCGNETAKEKRSGRTMPALEKASYGPQTNGPWTPPPFGSVRNQEPLRLFKDLSAQVAVFSRSES
jgi:hypothetical protein